MFVCGCVSECAIMHDDAAASVSWCVERPAATPKRNEHESSSKLKAHRIRVCAEGTENPERIIESLKNQTETDDKDLSPDGLVYNVTNFELEVER